MTTQVCSNCKIEKDIEEFHYHKAGKRRRGGQPGSTYCGWRAKTCNPCKRIQQAHKYNTDIEFRVRLLIRGSINNAIKFRHSPIIARVSDIVDAYDGTCHICGRPEEGMARRLSIDHCHKEGHFRGWLCINCNMLIGQSGDNIKILEKAIDYLRSNHVKG